MRLDALVAPLRADVVSGAAVIGLRAANVLGRAASQSSAESPAAFRDELVELGIRILEAKPAMAPLVALVSGVLTALSPDEELAQTRAAAIRVADGFREVVEKGNQAVAEACLQLLPEAGTVLTLSHSSTVRRAIEMAHESRGIGVVCLESRPMSEGRHLAEMLSRQGVRVQYAVDAAAASLLPSCDVVLMGADSIGDQGILNKIGSRLVAMAASDLKIPAYVLADRTKLLPPGFPQPTELDRPEVEVWKSFTGAEVWNRYFELVPLDRVTGVVTETGLATPAQVRKMREEIPVPAELRKWAEGRWTTTRQP